MQTKCLQKVKIPCVLSSTDNIHFARLETFTLFVNDITLYSLYLDNKILMRVSFLLKLLQLLEKSD